ncbi:hypothetical protein [Flavitalea sp.]|nr:hypothetical protein [Flavitalea sp.]
MKTILSVLPLLLFFTSCGKQSDNCAEIQQIKITGGKDSYYVGDTLDLKTNLLATSALYIWHLGENPNTISGGPGYFNPAVSKRDQGWYYLSVGNGDCPSQFDSIYIKVINLPAVAPCSVVTNTASFSSIPDIQFSSVTVERDGLYGRRTMTGYYGPGYPNLNIHFNMYWDFLEPEDGIYTIESSTALSDYNPYSIYISSKYSEVVFSSGPGKAYVTHVNGKLTVTFCDIEFVGTWGINTYKTTGSGMMTAP